MPFRVVNVVEPLFLPQPPPPPPIEQDVDENTCSVLLFLMNNLYNIKWHRRLITAGEIVAVC